MLTFIKKRLELKIALALILVLGTVIGTFTFLQVRAMRADTVRASEQNLGSLARVIKGSVTAAMMEGNHRDVQRIIDEIQNSFTVDGIIIYDERGVVLRRAKSAKQTDERIIEVPPSVLESISRGDRTEVSTRDGTPYLSYYAPIANRPECFRCHGRRSALNGVLRIDFSLQGVGALIKSRKTGIFIWDAIMVAALMAALVALLRVLVHRPVGELKKAMARVEEGKGAFAITTTGEDELSDLKRGFVSMMEKVNALHRTNLEHEKQLASSREAVRFRIELQTMFDTMPDGVLLVDPGFRIVQSNPRAYELLPGLSAAGEALSPSVLTGEGCPYRCIDAAFRDAVVIDQQCSVQVPGGKVRHVHCICAPIVVDGKVAFVVEVIRDISVRVKIERELEEKTRELTAANEALTRIATVDGLTQVFNRRHFDELLNKELKRFGRGRYSDLSVMMIDIDNFKEINDTHGHIAGDSILKEIAMLIRSNLRETDTAARYGGDEFVVVMPDAGRDSATSKAETIRVLVACRKFSGHGGPISVTVSIGVAAYSSGAPRDLLQAADLALYRAKHSGRNAVVVDIPAGDAATFATEKRRQTRFDCNTTIDYILEYDPHQNVQKAVMTDISNAGFGAYVYSPLRVGQTIIIKSALPVDCQRAVLRWIKEENDRFYKAGFLFDACPAPAASNEVRVQQTA
jgi:diguanylate cyclase (GGDEF)-like protein